MKHIYNGVKAHVRLNGDINDNTNGSLTIEEEIWVDSTEAARFLCISKKTLYNLTSNGTVKYKKFGKSNRYLLNKLRDLFKEKGEK